MRPDKTDVDLPTPERSVLQQYEYEHVGMVNFVINSSQTWLQKQHPWLISPEKTQQKKLRNVTNTTELVTRVKQVYTHGSPWYAFPGLFHICCTWYQVIHVDALNSEAGAGASLAQQNGEAMS